jgi:hypothetical protein
VSVSGLRLLVEGSDTEENRVTSLHAFTLTRPTVRHRETDVGDVTTRNLLYGLLPSWFVPGLADWVMHRRCRTSDERQGLRA